MKIFNHLGKKLFLLIFPGIFFSSVILGADLTGGYIQVLQTSRETNECIIRLILIEPSSSVNYLMPEELDFGDGTPVFSLSGQPADTIIRTGDMIKSIHNIKHNFPGPGTYTVGYKDHFRYGGMNYFPGNYYIPFYIETTIVIDPFLENNSTPVIKNDLNFRSRIGEPFNYTIMASDAEGDSISFSFRLPESDKNTVIPSYRYPAYTDPESGELVSRFSLEELSGQVFWERPGIPGHYTIAVDLKEWRYVSELDSWIEISKTAFDFDMIIEETTNPGPEIQSVQDTAIVFDTMLNFPYQVKDPDNDTLMVRHLGSVFSRPVHKPVVTLSDTSHYAGSAAGEFSWKPGLSSVRDFPYSFALQAEETHENRLTTQRVSWIWVTEKESDPGPPVHLTASSPLAGEIRMSWDFLPSAAGFIIERADDRFPEFRRLAGLSAGSTTYLDKNVIPGRNYSYRIRAVGTEASTYSEILHVDGDIILGETINRQEEGFEIYPNPADRVLVIRPGWIREEPLELEIFDISGKLILSYHLDTGLFDMMEIPLENLSAGIYILRVNGKNFHKSFRFTRI